MTHFYYHDFLKPKHIVNTIIKYRYFLIFLYSCFITSSIYLGIFTSTSDFQQGEVYRIIYLHVPFAWMSLICYLIMFINSLGFVIYKNPIFFIISLCTAVPGSLFCLLTLLTGSIWGKATWGTYWVWDARLTSVLILFFLYLIYIVISKSFQYKYNGSYVASVVCIFGFINIPIIKYSVNWWTTLHQGASINSFESTIHITILYPMVTMLIAQMILLLIYGYIFLYTELIRYKSITYLLNRSE